jgi:hypothetical protein
MILLTKQLFDNNCKRFGIKSYDKEVLEICNEVLMNYTRNSLEKAMKKMSKTQQQKGGRVVLPSDYFGVPSKTHFEHLSDHGVDMSVTEHMIRPHIPIKDLGAYGGASSSPCFTMPKTVMKYAVKEAMLSMSNQEVKLEKEAYNKLQFKFESLMTSALKTVSRKKHEHLTTNTLKEVFSTQKYKLLQ